MPALPTRLEQAIGAKPPYTEHRVLYFWFLYDWESCTKQLLLEPPKNYEYKPNEKLYFCELTIAPPDAGENQTIVHVVREEDATKQPLGDKDFSYYLARQLFLEASNRLPPGAYDNSGVTMRFGGHDFEQPEFTVKVKWGAYRVNVESIDPQEE